MATDLSGLLGRLRRRPSPRLKLLPGPGGLIGYQPAAPEVTADTGRMTALVRASCPTVDRSGDVVIAGGIDLGDHQKNPVVLLDHSRGTPVGKAESPDGAYTARLDGDALVATTHFAQGNRVAEEAFHLVATGVLRGVSVGILPKAATPNRTGGHRIERCLLVEYSHLTVPDNPDCLVIAVQKGLGGRPYSLPIQRLLMAATPPKRKPVVRGGYTRKDAYDPMAAGVAGLDEPTTPDPDADLPKVPPGAQALTSLYEWLMQGADQVSDASDLQENPQVKDHLDGILADIGEKAGEVAALFAQEYPDLPALSDDTSADDPDGDADDLAPLPEAEPTEKAGEGEEKPDEQDDEEGQKALRRRRLKVKCLALHRRWQARHKGLTRKAEQVVSDAADHLDEMGGYVGKMMSTHRTASRTHAKALRGLCKGMGMADDTEGGTLPSRGDEMKGLDLAAIQKALQPLQERLERLGGK